MVKTRRRATVSGRAGTTYNPSFSNPTPSPIDNLRYEEDATGNWIKWDKDTAAYMTGGSYVIQRSLTEGGTYKIITGGTITQASVSGNTVSFKDVDPPNEVGGWWYRVKKVSKDSKSSVWSLIRRPATTDFCDIIVRAVDIVGEFFTKQRTPKVTFEFENTTAPVENEALNSFLLIEKPPAIILDTKGNGRKKMYRSSFVGNATYKAKLIVSGKRYNATGITFPDQTEAYLHDIATFS